MQEVVISLIGDDTFAYRLGAPLHQRGFRIVELCSKTDVVRSVSFSRYRTL